MFIEEETCGNTLELNFRNFIGQENSILFKKKKKKKNEEKKIGMQKEHRKYNFKVTLHYQTNMMTLNEKLSCYGFNSAMNSG